MRILITGAGGQLGTALGRALSGHETVLLTHAELDICDEVKLQSFVEKHRPDCIINTAAFHKVDFCEDAVAESFAVNALAVHGLVRAANSIGGKLVHFSTDYVFDGNQSKPYTESDRPDPLSVYAMSKLAGEMILRRYCQAGYLIRTCGLYGRNASGDGGSNFVETMLSLARQKKSIQVVSDQIVTPTSAAELARRLVPLLESGAPGLYHMTNRGECSWYQFAREIFRLSGVRPDLRPVTAGEFGAKAPRPAYSVLDGQAYRAAGFADFRPWQEALAEYLEERNLHSPEARAALRPS